MDSERSEYLLRLLSKAASLCESDREAALVLLRESQAHLWRLSRTEPLGSAMELERKLSQPMENWLPESVQRSYSGPLLASGLPTQTCSEMLLELDAQQLSEAIQANVREVLHLCRVISNGDALYRRFRRFLIENPVIETVQAAAIFIPLGRKLEDFYEPIPEHFAIYAKLYRCPECRWPMNPQRREIQCDSAWCREKNSLYRWESNRLINFVTNQKLEGETAGKRYRLKSALWKYTLLPGLLELQLAEQLSEHGLDVTLWPDVDRSDLRVTQGAMTTDLDAEVWVSPLALGRYLENLEYSSPRWIVIPDYQKSHLDWLRSICATRYQVDDKLLKDPWQQLGVTEITVIEPGAFAPATVIVEQVALLCRNAPLWDGQLKLPNPMHLGAQVAGDHPIMEMHRKSEANRIAEKA